MNNARRFMAASFVLAVTLAACSSLNREGPSVTCADLKAGSVNACKQGIIASCKDGNAVSYQVCTDGNNPESLCEASWQVPGAYQCQQTGTSGPQPGPTGADGAAPIATDGAASAHDSGVPSCCQNPSRTTACSRLFQDSTCDTCIDQSCCSPAAACNANADCKTILSCLANCGPANPQTCKESCKSASPAGLSDYNALSQCSSPACPGSCNP